MFYKPPLKVNTTSFWSSNGSQNKGFKYKCILREGKCKTEMFSQHFFPPVHLWACVTAGGPHPIGCLGFEASLPPHSQRETIPCDLWPSPPSNRPRQHSALKTGTGKRNFLTKKKVTQPTQTHTDTPMTNERTQKDNKYRRKKNINVDTHMDMQTSYILTKTYIPGDTLDSLTNTHIFIPADIKYKHI